MTDNGIRLLVGLGNPGPEYADHRHNAGFWFVDRLAERAGASFRAESKFHGLTCRVENSAGTLLLLKPTTFMNHSGRAVVAMARYFDIPPAQLLVCYDELDLPVGTARLKQGGGHGGHNGVRDSISALGSPDFWRLRIGIGHPGDKSLVVNYVLSRPSRADGDLMRDAIDDAEGCLGDLQAGRFQAAMNRLHSGR